MRKRAGNVCAECDILCRFYLLLRMESITLSETSTYQAATIGAVTWTWKHMKESPWMHEYFSVLYTVSRPAILFWKIFWTGHCFYTWIFLRLDAVWCGLRALCRMKSTFCGVTVSFTYEICHYLLLSVIPVLYSSLTHVFQHFELAMVIEK